VSTKTPNPKAGTASSRVPLSPHSTDSMDSSFAEVVGLIEQARQRAYQAVNSELVGLYWRIGEYISAKLAAAVWGEGVVDSLAQHLARTMPGQRGFTRHNLFRMRQFFEAYGTADKKVTALLTQLPWTHNLIILTQSKRPEEREFYLRLAVQARWTSREMERQYCPRRFKFEPPCRLNIEPGMEADVETVGCG
jgi:predicted nuclease of restriction endonuclease-like (RecB) superfamily